MTDGRILCEFQNKARELSSAVKERKISHQNFVVALFHIFPERQITYRHDRHLPDAIARVVMLCLIMLVHKTNYRQNLQLRQSLMNLTLQSTVVAVPPGLA
jgi:hypothetical protein